MALAARMRAASMTEEGCFRVERVPVPQPEAGQVRYRVHGCGVSVPGDRGPVQVGARTKPGWSGAEGWGIVDAVGTEVSSVRRGERIAALSGNAFAEFDVVDESAAVVLPAGFPEQPFPGSSLGGALNVIERARVRPGQVVAVVGIGFLGAVLVQLAARAGASVIALSRRPFSLSLAREMAASSVVEIENHGQALREVDLLSRGRWCDTVLEATGQQAGLSLAAALVAKRGTLVIAGRHHGARSVDLELWAERGFDVINAHEGGVEACTNGMRAAIRSIQAAELCTASLYTHEYGLEELDEALRIVRNRPVGLIKAVIKP